jgi:hypothetical protein
MWVKNHELRLNSKVQSSRVSRKGKEKKKQRLTWEGLEESTSSCSGLLACCIYAPHLM